MFVLCLLSLLLIGMCSSTNVNVRECFKVKGIIDCRDKAGEADIMNYGGDVDVERMLFSSIEETTQLKHVRSEGDGVDFHCRGLR